LGARIGSGANCVHRCSERTEFDPGDVLFAMIDRPTRFEVLSEEAAEYFVIQEPG
jgi:hypothetical protein